MIKITAHQIIITQYTEIFDVIIVTESYVYKQISWAYKMWSHEELLSKM